MGGVTGQSILNETAVKIKGGLFMKDILVICKEHSLSPFINYH